MDLKNQGQPEADVSNSLSTARNSCLLTIGAIASILAALIRKNFSAEYYLLREFGVFNAGPTTAPTTANGWFALLQDQPGLGLLMLDIFDVVYFCIVIFLFIGLFGVFRKTKLEPALLALSLGIIGALFSIIVNPSMGMLHLSDLWAGASPEEKFLYEAAGEALLATYNASTVDQSIAIYLSDIFVPGAALIFANLMRGDPRFKNSTSILGIVANGILLTKIPILLSVPSLVFIAPSFSAVFLLIWYVSVGIQMWRVTKKNRTQFPKKQST